MFGDLTVSIDYFNIKINNVISTVPGLTVLSKCYNLDGSNSGYSASNEFCRLIGRDQTTGQILQVATPYLNLGSLKTDGIEAQVHWGVRAPFLGDGVKLYVDTNIGYLNNYKVQLLPGSAVLDYTGISVGGTSPGSVPPRAAPRWRALTTFGVKNDSFGAGLRWRYQSSMKDASSILTPANAAVGVPSYQLWDLFGSVKVSKNFELRAGVNNLLDEGLPFVASSQNNTDTALYDAVGRSYYMGLKIGF